MVGTAVGSITGSSVVGCGTRTGWRVGALEGCEVSGRKVGWELGVPENGFGLGALDGRFGKLSAGLKLLGLRVVGTAEVFLNVGVMLGALLG